MDVRDQRTVALYILELRIFLNSTCFIVNSARCVQRKAVRRSTSEPSLAPTLWVREGPVCLCGSVSGAGDTTWGAAWTGSWWGVAARIQVGTASALVVLVGDMVGDMVGDRTHGGVSQQLQFLFNAIVTLLLQHFFCLRHYCIDKHAALHYRIIHFGAVHFRIIHLTTVHYCIINHTALHYRIINHTALHYRIIYYTELFCRNINLHIANSCSSGTDNHRRPPAPGFQQHRLRSHRTSRLCGKRIEVDAIRGAECGIPMVGPKNKVVGGKAAEFGAYPWQVSVRRTSLFGLTSGHRCGGALVNLRWTATAAHCVDDVLTSQLRVRAGEHDFQTTREPFPHEERAVSRKVLHPAYKFFTYENDLALLRAEAPFAAGMPHVAPICLPSPGEALEGRTATLTGWGRLAVGKCSHLLSATDCQLCPAGGLPAVLQEVQVPILSNHKCKRMFMAAGKSEHVPDIFLCAGYEEGGRDSCQGDSGGPLQVRGEDGRWFLAGIISWGIGCGEPNLPGVCTRISKFKDWMEAVIAS
ncbi:hypothetical protein LAZ67_15003188 [Cordylochernes scorpioides]|uniref:Peptidase S1 domain-containing protein n=1 Tax=Cordylochernes scorpioides TaxID=51811 RepID=A0ABY6LA30_9ARAC|nr:hypothetical protein LAZ67_15003188 [Cordylochernes scorpioides]